LECMLVCDVVRNQKLQLQICFEGLGIGALKDHLFPGFKSEVSMAAKNQKPKKRKQVADMNFDYEQELFHMSHRRFFLGGPNIRKNIKPFN
jgi:hypothetical protein